MPVLSPTACPVPIAEVAAYAAGQIQSVAAALSPGTPVRLDVQMPSVTSYVCRIHVGQTPMFAKTSLLGVSLVSLLRGTCGGWETVRVAQAAYATSPGSVLEREAAQLWLLHRQSALRVAQVEHYGRGVLITRPVPGPTLEDLVLREPERTGDLLGTVMAELDAALTEPAVARQVDRFSIWERSIDSTFARKFNGISGPHYVRLAGDDVAQPLATVIGRLRRLRLADAEEGGAVVTYGDLKPEHAVFPQGLDGRPVFIAPGLARGRRGSDEAKLISRLVLRLLVSPPGEDAVRGIVWGIDEFARARTTNTVSRTRDKRLRQLLVLLAAGHGQYHQHLSHGAVRPSAAGSRCADQTPHRGGAAGSRPGHGHAGGRHRAHRGVAPGADRGQDRGSPVTRRPVATVGVIGAGAVGQTVGALLVASPDWCGRVFVASRTPESAAGLVTDLEDLAQVVGSPVRAHVAEVADMGTCHAIVICPRAAFANSRSTDVRMAGLAANAPVLRSVAAGLGGYDGVAVVVTNPVDIMARVFAETSGCRRTYGIGSNTDSARYRIALAQALGVPVEAVEGQVIGEHGDAAVICASATRVGGMPATVPVRAVRDELAARPRRINAGCGRARSGPAGAVLAALQHALGHVDGVIELSVNHEGVWTGMPLRFTDGNPTVCLPHLNTSETRLLAAARTKLRAAYQQVLPAHLSEGDHRPMPRSVRISTADHGVTITSNHRAVTDWALRYFGPWWSASNHDVPDSDPKLVADVDKNAADELTQHVRDFAHEETVYANAPLLHVRDEDGTVTAAQPGDQLAYQHTPDGQIRIVGADDLPVCLAASRLAREVVRGQLLADGWSILHASAVTNDAGETLLTLGNKGAGKTTTALLLAREDWRLLANDRVFVRADQDGVVRVLPWPAAAAIGFGLLDSLGLYDHVRTRLLGGGKLHPTQHEKVTDALLVGDRTPLRNDSGKELKVQFFPDQLATWLHLALAAEGHATRFLFPRITPGGTPALLDEDRPLADGDFFTAASEDRYPDVFSLTPSDISPAPRATHGVLADLPRHVFTLGHDAAANAEFLKNLTAAR
ncbi:lactate/malate family dehydrogenase [Streptomyces olivoreticuli]